MKGRKRIDARMEWGTRKPLKLDKATLAQIAKLKKKARADTTRLGHRLANFIAMRVYPPVKEQHGRFSPIAVDPTFQRSYCHRCGSNVYVLTDADEPILLATRMKQQCTEVRKVLIDDRDDIWPQALRVRGVQWDGKDWVPFDYARAEREANARREREAREKATRMCIAGCGRSVVYGMGVGGLWIHTECFPRVASALKRSELSLSRIETLIKLCHPDKHHGAALEREATEITKWLLELRKGARHV